MAPSKQRNLLQQQQQSAGSGQRSRSNSATKKSTGGLPALGRSPLTSEVYDDLDLSSPESNSPPWSPTSFATGLMDSRRGRRLISYDFTKPEWVNLDLFQSHSALAQQDLYVLEGEERGTNELLSRLWRMVQIPCLLCIVACLSAAAGWLVDAATQTLLVFRGSMVPADPTDQARPAAYATVCFTLIAAAALLTHTLCPLAAGGGVPEMKTVLSGSINPALLSPRLIMVKFGGLVLASAAGMSVGKEGPLIHISCALAEAVMSLAPFKYLRVNAPMRLEILACACAAGVAAAFGSAFGATLFSLEITATCYMVSGLPRAFTTAMLVVLLYWFWGADKMDALFADPSAIASSFKPTDMALWALLGVLCGLVGSAVVGIVSAISSWRNRVTRPALGPAVQRNRRLLVCALFSAVVVPLSYIELLYFERANTSSAHALVDHLFAPKAVGLSWKLAAFVPLKALAIVLSVTQPLPVGLFSPVFLLGAALGRLFGEGARYLELAHGLIQLDFAPWEFSVIGAAALSGSITGAVSTAVIVFEMSGQNHLRVPLGVAVLIAHGIASRLTKGAYESLVDTNGHPYLPRLPPPAYLVEVENIMVPADSLPYLALSTTYSAAARLLAHHPPTAGATIPVVQTEHDMILVGAVLRADLAMAVKDYEYRVAAAERESTAEGRADLVQAAKDYERRTSSFSPALHHSSSSDLEDGRLAVTVTDKTVKTVTPEPKHPAVTGSTATVAKHSTAAATAASRLFSQLGRSSSATSLSGSAHKQQQQQQQQQRQHQSHNSLSSYANANGHSSSSHQRSGSESAKQQQRKKSSAPGSISGSVSGASHAETARPGSAGSRRDSKHTILDDSLLGGAHLRFVTVKGPNRVAPVVDSHGHAHCQPHLLRLSSINTIPIVMDPSPFQVAHSTELRKLDYLYRMLKVDVAFVCRAGRLIGWVTRGTLRRFIGAREPQPLDECIGVCSSLTATLSSAATPVTTRGSYNSLHQRRDSSSRQQHRSSRRNSARSSQNGGSFDALLTVNGSFFGLDSSLNGSTASSSNVAASAHPGSNMHAPAAAAAAAVASNGGSSARSSFTEPKGGGRRGYQSFVEEESDAPGPRNKR